ncbi:hypothetical protein DFH08DRAFT_810180 [Mycena albidolilacea]|uniref:Uncharacterized protein n=1 Tax=Mycena albidolilacea TaxID=1033008 RepID=A0AAD7EQI7_9AGAR|nr:hypothetical protein DFH08DRAFT_810180 [Mycena albidolilacea]
MFSKTLTFGIGALALVQGALAIAEGRYIITNPAMGTLFRFTAGPSLRVSRDPSPPPPSQNSFNHSTYRFKTARAVKKQSIRRPCPSRARAAALVSGGWINGICPSMDPDSTCRRREYLAAHYPAEKTKQCSTLATPPEFPASRSRL